MNSNQNSVIKMVVILAILFLAVGGVTYMRRSNSQTLTEYTQQQAALRGTDTESQTTETDDTTSEEEGAVDTKESEETGNTSIPASNLIGATLNRGIPTEQITFYTEGFYYAPLSDNLRRYITGISYPSTDEELAISYEDLCYVHIWHYNFDGEPAEGELICNRAIAQDLVEIFYALYYHEYQIEKVHLVDEYDGDDTASMEANNTSCFNYRLVEGSSSLSRHALGLALDINPYYNPYVTYTQDGSQHVSPEAAEVYADRSGSFPYKIDENDLCYQLFTEHGFIWGGNWNSLKDYQHFQKAIE